MPVSRYLAMRSVRTLDEFNAVRAAEDERVRAEAEVRAERLRERAREAVSL